MDTSNLSVFDFYNVCTYVSYNLSTLEWTVTFQLCVRQITLRTRLANMPFRPPMMNLDLSAWKSRPKTILEKWRKNTHGNRGNIQRWALAVFVAFKVPL